MSYLNPLSSYDEIFCHAMMPASVTSILCYNGSHIDVLLNYSALIIDSTSTIILLHHLPSSSFGRLRYFSFPFIILLFLFQVELCLIVGCTGISIIWSALCGFNLYSYSCFSKLEIYDKFNQLFLQQVLVSSSIFSLSLWMYYFVVADGMTSLAHLCAVLLGFLSGYFMQVYIRLYHPSQFVSVKDDVHQDLPLIHPSSPKSEDDDKPVKPDIR
jgi:hypothetical protein